MSHYCFKTLMKIFTYTMSDDGLISHLACSLKLICTSSTDISAPERAPFLWGTLEPCFRVLSSPAAHTHSLIEPICKLTPHHSPALPLASGVPLNRPTHSLLVCFSELCRAPASHFKHTHPGCRIPARTRRRRKWKEVSGSPQRQRNTWGALTSLHCTQLPVCDYWLLWQLACRSAVAVHYCTLTLLFLHHGHFSYVFAFLYCPQSVWVCLISSASSFTISLLPGNSHFPLCLFTLFYFICFFLLLSIFLPFCHL